MAITYLGIDCCGTEKAVKHLDGRFLSKLLVEIVRSGLVLVESIVLIAFLQVTCPPFYA